MQLRWGIISVGLISQDFCTAMKTLDTKEHLITAVAARNLNDAKNFAEKFNIKSYFDNYDQVCKSDEVDIVYIGTLNNTHKELSLKAIENGKHVLCEKPMSLNCKEQEEIFNAAKIKGVFAMEALWTRFFPVMQKLKEEIKNGSIGEVKHCQASMLLNKNDIERIKQKEYGGGGLLDLGIYPIQFAVLAFNHETPIEIIASGNLMETGVDENLTIILKYTNNRMAIISMSTKCGIYSGGVVAGEKGVLTIPEFLWCPTKLILANGETFETPLPECGPINYWNCVGLRFQAEAARESIMLGLKEHSFVAHEHTLLIRKIMDEARKQIGYTLSVD